MASPQPAPPAAGGWSAGCDTGSATGVTAGPTEERADQRTDHRRRGELRIYLGAAPGVGKTFAMLGEGRRRRDRGADVVVGFVETHGRELTAQQIGDLEIVPRRLIDYQGATFEEMDVDAVLARRPDVALVDELAHTNVPGSRNARRGDDVKELLAAGISVITTVNIQHLESLNDVVERITGITQRETIPDDLVRSADQVELVDMAPEALRRRMAHGNIYAADKIDAALGNYFRVGNLTALRELALLWVTDQVDAALDDYRERHGIRQPWEVRERVIVAVTGAPESKQLIRPIDVHVISYDGAEEQPIGPRLPIPKFVLSPLPPRRQAIGWIVATAGLPLLTLALANLRGELGLPSVLLLYLVFAMAVGAAGGVFPALAAAVAGSLLANYFFTPPYYRFTIQQGENLLALVLYLGAAGIVSVLVDRVGRSRLETARARAEAEAMAELAGSLAHEDALPSLVRHLRTTFAMQAVALLRRDGEDWHVEAEAGVDVPGSPNAADVVKEIGNNLVLVMTGSPLVGADHRVLNALSAQLATAVEAKRLHGEAARAMTLAQANDLRSALLQAVSHDLRTPLSSIKASISSVRQPDVTWAPDQLDEFHAIIEEETDRLDGLVANLLDMSRLQAGALHITNRSVGLEEVIPAAVASLGARGQGVVVDAPETLPPVDADPALLERALANLLDNAVSASPPDRPVRIAAGAVADRVDTRIIDQGPGIPRQDRDLVFQPFQRLVDHGSGVGLGLAIARGFVDAMGGELTLDDTPGGGVTMVISLPRAL